MEDTLKLELLFLLDDHGVDEIRRSRDGSVNFIGMRLRMPFSDRLVRLLEQADLRDWLKQTARAMPSSYVEYPTPGNVPFDSWTHLGGYSGS